MEALSVSFRIGDGVLEHNNREFSPHNVDIGRTPDNIIKSADLKRGFLCTAR